MIGVLVFLLLVLLIYRAAPSPSTNRLFRILSLLPTVNMKNLTYELAYGDPLGCSQILGDTTVSNDRYQNISRI